MQVILWFRHININVMKFKIVNSWTSKVKQSDKLEVAIRISKLTVFEVIGDWSKKEISLALFNFKAVLKF